MSGTRTASVGKIERIWHVAPMDRARCLELGALAGLPPLAAHLLLQRGIDTEESCTRFLQPRLAHLSDPFCLTDMDKAVARIEAARQRQERVLIFGDYDVDGVAATAILYNGLRRYGLEHVSYDMPIRLTEGYGLSVEHVKAAQAQGVTLIITVDNGISAQDAAARARELGVDLIVTDHHAIERGLPPAAAVLNPQREPEDHPCRFLCGAGVAFKLSTALNGTPNDLDIAALGAVADIVPLQRENRTIVALGLKHIAHHQRTAIRELAAVAKVKLAEISSESIGFQLGPRLNAAGRLDDAKLALKLLLCEDAAEAGKMARLLDAANRERREIEDAISREAVEEVEHCIGARHCSIVLANETWHAGVIGIVASRLQRRFNRPVMLIAWDEDGIGKGSGRSGPGFDMAGALHQCAEHLLRYGGHAAAGGISIAREAFEAFREAFEAEASRQLGDGHLCQEVAVDAAASFSEIDPKLMNALARLEPVGHGNPAPVFCSYGVQVAPGSPKLIGEQHVRLALRQNNCTLPAIGWRMAERFFQEANGGLPDVVYRPQFHTWGGQTTIRLVLQDFRPAQEESRGGD